MTLWCSNWIASVIVPLTANATSVLFISFVLFFPPKAMLSNLHQCLGSWSWGAANAVPSFSVTCLPHSVSIPINPPWGRKEHRGTWNKNKNKKYSWTMQRRVNSACAPIGRRRSLSPSWRIRWLLMLSPPGAPNPSSAQWQAVKAGTGTSE